MARRKSSSWLFKGLLFAGALLALALLAQTVVSYRYVTESLIRQEARRAAEERVRGFERAVRIAHVQEADAYQRLLDDYRDDVSDQIAAILVLRADGTVLASSGAPMNALAPEDRRAFLTTRAAPPTSAQIGGQASLVGIFACRCAPSPRPDSRGDGSDRVFVQMAVYRDSLSAPFARLRRNAAVSAAAAIALLVALGLLALRVGPYVRGKQLEGQLLLARQVQRALLPPPEAWPAGVDGAAVCVPAAQIGGDFYEVQQVAGGRVAFSLGDVSGHGISAALLMSMMHGAMGNGAGRAEDGPDQTAARLNGLLLKKSSGERFASMISCVYEPRTGRLEYVNAGHPPGLLVQHGDGSAQGITRLADGGPVLGVLQNAVYRSASIETHEGDLLVLFSDGIVEAMNGADEFFGEGRLLEVIEGHRQQLGDSICRAVLSAVQQFSGRRPAEDDRTVLVIRLWRATGEGAVAA